MRKIIAALVAATLTLSVPAVLAVPAVATAPAAKTTAAAPFARPVARPVTWVVARPCQVLRTLPAYRYREQGATITMPTGAARYADAAADVRGVELERACRLMVTEQRTHKGAPAATLTVLREWGF